MKQTAMKVYTLPGTSSTTESLYVEAKYDCTTLTTLSQKELRSMLRVKKQYKWFTLLSGSLIILAFVLAACGGSSTSSGTAGSASIPASANNAAAMGQHLAANGQNANKTANGSATC